MLRYWIIGLALASASVPAALAAEEPPASTAWADKVVPIEVFGQFPAIEGPRISPNGKLIAAKVRSGDVQVLALIPVGDSAAKPQLIARDGDLTKDKYEEKQITGYRWIDDDNLLIFFLSRNNFQGEWYDDGRIIAYNRITRKMSKLGWEHSVFSASDVLWMSPPGTPAPHILLQRYTDMNSGERLFNPEVLDIDVVTGETRIVQRSNPIVRDWVADRRGVVRLGSSRDRDTGKVRILYRDDASGNFRTIVNEKADMHTDLTAPDIILSNNKAYALNNKDGYRALYEYDLASMTLGKKIFSVEGYDLGDLNASPDGASLESIHWSDKRSRTRFLEPRLKAIQTMLEESFGKGNVMLNSADLKREKIVFTYSQLGQAPTVYLYDTVSGGIGRVGYYSDALKDAKLNPVSVIRYPASDGKSIEAILTMPRHRAGQKNLPLIIMPHGGPWARDDADWDAIQWAQALAEQGYVVIQPNYRGSTGYGKDWGKAVDGNWGLRMQDDLNDAIPYLASQGIADPKRVCMFGWSYGGYAASRAAQRDGSKYRCTISGAGVHDLPAMVSYDKNYLGEYNAKIGLGAAGAKLDAISPSLHAADYSTPILIIHGAKDQRVPVSQSRNLVERLKRAGKVQGRDFVYVEQPLNTHNLLREEDRIQVLTEIKKFLAQHNPA